jgi:hypothetical protein
MGDFGTAIGQLGGFLGMGFNQMGQDQQNYNTQQFMAMQHSNQRNLNEQMQQIQQENWDYTNYENQVKHLKNAGLNVGLLYGQGGAGGSTMGGASGGSAAMGSAAQNNTPQVMAQMLQAMMMKSEIAKNESEANRNNADADKKRGVETRLGETQIGSLNQGIENQKAQQKLTEIETDLKGIEYELKNATFDDSVDIVKNEKNKQLKQIYILEKEGLIKNEEAKVKARELDLKLAGMSLDNAFTKMNTKLSEEKIAQVKQDVINSIDTTWATKKNAYTNEQNLWNEQDKVTLQRKLGEAGLSLTEQGQILGFVGSLFGASAIGTRATR